MAEFNDLKKAYQIIVNHLMENTQSNDEKENFVGTAERCARALQETCKSEDYIYEEIEKLLSRVFPSEHNESNDLAYASGGIICQGPIVLHSSCPHHLYPVIYHAYIAYIPKDNMVLGLSKIARVAKLLASRPVLQEQLANDIADTFCRPAYYDENTDEYEYEESRFPSLISNGSAVLLIGAHQCMSCRGVLSDAKTVISELRGSFLSSDMEQKFYSLVSNIRAGEINGIKI